MADNWAADVKKYVADADEKAIAGIVKYCGIALQNRDSSLVSFTDKEEVARVRNNFLKKKLGLTNSNSELDKAIMAAADKMKGDRPKSGHSLLPACRALRKALNVRVRLARSSLIILLMQLGTVSQEGRRICWRNSRNS